MQTGALPRAGAAGTVATGGARPPLEPPPEAEEPPVPCPGTARRRLRRPAARPPFCPPSLPPSLVAARCGALRTRGALAGAREAHAPCAAVAHAREGAARLAPGHCPLPVLASRRSPPLGAGRGLWAGYPGGPYPNFVRSAVTHFILGNFQ